MCWNRRRVRPPIARLKQQWTQPSSELSWTIWCWSVGSSMNTLTMALNSANHATCPMNCNRTGSCGWNHCYCCCCCCSHDTDILLTNANTVQWLNAVQLYSGMNCMPLAANGNRTRDSIRLDTFRMQCAQNVVHKSIWHMPIVRVNCIARPDDRQSHFHLIEWIFDYKFWKMRQISAVRH